MHSQLPDPIFKRIQQCGVIAVLVIEDARHAVPLARALIEGGVQAMELTLRTPAALEALRLVKAEVPEMLAGVGTVITPEQVADIVRLKADFAVAPGTSPRVIAAARAHGLPFVPGVATPSDISTAVELGCRELKFFSGGAQRRHSVFEEHSSAVRASGPRFYSPRRCVGGEPEKLPANAFDPGGGRIVAGAKPLDSR